MSVLVIADPGSTHDGQLDRMYRLIDAAAAAGANVVKFQWTSSPERLAERRHAPEYVDAYRLIAFPQDWHERLALRCEQARVEYMCTCYLASDLPFVAPYVRRWKVASFEARDRAFLEAHLAYPKSMIVSTGGMNDREVVELANWLENNAASWCMQEDYLLLHCVAAYPAPPEEMNLLTLGDYDGLSDHSMSPVVAAMAVARGAEIIEAHLRLDDCPPGNADYPHSMPPARFTEYVGTIRLAERIMGDGVKKVMPSEEPWARYSVRS